MNQSIELSAFAAVVRRDLAIAWRQRAEVGNALGFLLVVISLFPLAMGPEVRLLERIAPGVIWIAALLSAMLTMDALFRSDFEDGSLEQMLLSPAPLPLIVLAKVCAHWLSSAVPVILFAPLLALMLQMKTDTALVLLATLALGTPLISLVGAVGSALTVAHRRGGALMSLLVLPLLIPVLIMSTSAVDAAGAAMPFDSYLFLLGALLMLGLTLAPFAVALALRVNLE